MRYSPISLAALLTTGFTAAAVVGCGFVTDLDGLGNHQCLITESNPGFDMDMDIVHTEPRKCPVPIGQLGVQLTYGGFLVDQIGPFSGANQAHIDMMNANEDPLFVSHTQNFMPRAGYAWAVEFNVNYPAATLQDLRDFAFVGVNDPCCYSGFNPWAKDQIAYTLGGGGGQGPPGGTQRRGELPASD